MGLWFFIVDVRCALLFYIANNTLLQDGTIFAWRYNVATNSFEPAASLKGHSRAVVTLVVGANKVYSGSMDTTVRVSSCFFFSLMNFLKFQLKSRAKV